MWDLRRVSSLPSKLIFFVALLPAILLTSCASTLPQERGESALPGTSSEESKRSAPASRSSSGPRIPDFSACLGCHQYRENHHPVDFAPRDPSRFPFPLYDGKVRCLTCHTEDHQEGSGNLLRGGPYADRRGICFKCHHEDEYSAIYPHVMLDDGKIVEVNGKPVCLVCHAKTPDPRVDRTKDVVFRADVAFLCWRCHSLMAKVMLNEHVLLKPPTNMLRYIEQNEERMKIIIPLVPRDRITCSTCHNPHQKGVIIYGPSAKGADAPDRLRLPEPALCLVCHKM